MIAPVMCMSLSRLHVRVLWAYFMYVCFILSPSCIFPIATCSSHYITLSFWYCMCHFVTPLPCNPTSQCNCVNLSLFTMSPCHYPCCPVTVSVCHFVTYCCSLILHLTLEGGLSTVMSMLTVLPDPEVQPSALKVLLAMVTAEE